jgi:23S rRNA pseudouridine1911/1915/1917 synthase
MLLTADRRERLDRFLARMLPEHSRTKLVKIIDTGEVLVDGETQKSSFMLDIDAQVTLEEPGESAPHDLTPADIALDVRYEDEYLLVVNKPRGLATHPALSLKEPSLVNALLARPHALSSTGESFRPGIVHRLDKETTGLIIIAKTDAAHVSLAKQIEEKTAERRYFAVVGGEVERDKFTIDAPIGRDPRNRQKMAVDQRGKHAVTHVLKIARVDAGTLLAVRLETGRTHQIRVHLRAIGNPIVGDAVYATKALSTGPLQLHAAYLRFTHPVSGETIEVFAPAPADFMSGEFATLEQIKRMDAPSE